MLSHAMPVGRVQSVSVVFESGALQRDDRCVFLVSGSFFLSHTVTHDLTKVMAILTNSLTIFSFFLIFSLFPCQPGNNEILY